MFNHEPPNYECPFCLIAHGGGDGLNDQDDVFYRTETVTAFMAPQGWPNNRFHVMVVPNEHYENIYDTPDHVLAEVYAAVKQISIAMRQAYGCDATSNRQHNEPDGNQAIWHLHVHVIPRYQDDHLYLTHDQKMSFDRAERQEYAQKLRLFLTQASNV